MSLKDTRIIDLNLFSGSSELMRQALGGHYYNSGAGKIEFKPVGFDSVVQIERFVHSDPNNATDSILPKISYISRILINEADTDIVSDENWKTFIIGGEFGDKTYPGIYNENVYPDHFNSSSLPLLPRELVNTNQQPSLTLTTEYFNYYPRYQAEVARQQSALMAPNYYMLPYDFLSKSADTNSCIAETTFPQINNFLTNSYVNSTKTYDSTLENIFIPEPTGLSDAHNLDKGDDLKPGHMDSDLQKRYSLMPFGNKLVIDPDLATTQTSYRDIIESNNYEIKLLKLLKETFQGESSLQTANVNFAVNTKAEISTGTATGLIESTTTVPVKIVDAPTMLLYAARNPISETNNITVYGSGSYSSTMDYVFDTTGIYRFENTEASYAVLNDFIKEIKAKFIGEPITYPMTNFLGQADKEKYHETLAFRIEKIGGGPTGDSNTENTIQNIWFYNVNKLITYLDTQVKYDTEYTYKVYKYDIVQGYKYQLSDIITTRQIATTTSGETNVYCLEFYDPFTGQISDDLLDAGNSERIARLRKTILDDRISGLSGLVESAASPGRSLELQTQFVDALQTFLDQVGGGTLIEDTTLYTESETRMSDNLYFYVDYLTEFLDNEKVVFPYYIRNVTSPGLPLENIDSFLYSMPIFGDDVVMGTTEYTGTSTQGNLLYIDFSSYTIEEDVVEQVGSLIEQLSADAAALGEIILPAKETLSELREELSLVESFLGGDLDNSLFTNAQINSSSPRLADFKISIEPSLKIIEIPLDEKRMRIVDHPPNDFAITPHHLLDQSNRLAFYCKYDTFSMYSATYPPVITSRDQQNKSAYLVGNDFIQTSEQTQESVSRPRFIEVYRTTTKPTSYRNFAGALRKTIDLRQSNGDIPTDHLFVERVRENTKYYYAFRALNENGVAGQLSPVFEAELINDGGYVYGAFEQFSEEDLAVPPPKEPLLGFKKLLNIIPNIQHLQLDTSTATFASSSISQIPEISLGSNAEDTLWNDDKYYKIRLTSKKTGKKIDLNVSFKKE